MCVLAVTGQLGGSQMCELNDHISHCDSCRKNLESVAHVSVQTMPLLASRHVTPTNGAPRDGMRERFLERINKQVGNASPISLPWAQRASSSKPVIVAPKELIEKAGSKASISDLFDATLKHSRFPWRAAAGVIACAAIAFAGYYVGQWRAKHSLQEVTRISSPSLLPKPENKPTENAARVAQLEQQKTELEAQLSELKKKLASAKTEQQALNEELASAHAKLAGLAQAQIASQQSLAEAQDAKNQLATAEAQVRRLNQRLADFDVKLAVQKQTSDELSTKLQTTETDLQQERDLKSAKTQMGDLVAARNLHIVDVYDADPNGKRQRAFGRVFYIEGKSLVFYAYDLETSGQLAANVVFHVWGGKAGVKEVTRNLGMLHKDDDGQSRWTMTFDDPKVLGQINTVFVTAESASKHSDAPHGKKVLYAYFGSPPNHP